MLGEDHLDTETSVSAELTPTGVKASAKSRFVAAIDRMGGNIVDLLNAPMEAKSAERRALTAGRIRAIEAVTQLGIDRLKSDPDFAERALRSHLGSVFARQDNKDGVLLKAIEDLRRQPPTDEEATNGAEVLEEAFQSRFERYAEEATTEELREKWGRVLASEIRKPNTFSRKALRVVDELDAATAKVFERVCEARLGNTIPKALIGEIAFHEIAKLVTADLLIEPGMGQVQHASETNDSAGVDLWLWAFDTLAVAATKETYPDTPFGEETKIFNFEGGQPQMPVYVLTDVGRAIASILPDNLAENVGKLVVNMSEAMPNSEVRRYVSDPLAKQWKQVERIPPRERSGGNKLERTS